LGSFCSTFFFICFLFSAMLVALYFHIFYAIHRLQEIFQRPAGVVKKVIDIVQTGFFMFKDDFILAAGVLITEFDHSILIGNLFNNAAVRHLDFELHARNRLVILMAPP
jgi:hypothetical protein